MTNEAKLYADLFEHIQAFDYHYRPDEDNDWAEFIRDIKQRIVFQYMDAYNKQSPDST